MSRSRNASSYRRHCPKHIRKLMFERPLRAQHKREMRRATWCRFYEPYLRPFFKDADMYWW